MKNGINGKSLREKLLYLNKNLGTFDKSHICFEAFLNNEEVIKVFDNIENKDFSEEHLKGILNNFYYLYEGIYFNLHLLNLY